ncbi:LytR/AlgR family response regulator transcription factor [Okeania hirsuta]|nr:LytTR family DNA-binding domain-containing protein [Okeania hirsuta]
MAAGKEVIGIAEHLNQRESVKVPRANEEDKLLFDIPSSQIRYIQGLQNYVSLVYVDNSGSIKKKTERATLKNILDQLEGSSIVRSHRSFLVNRASILSASGNAQGLLLTLSDCDQEVPVSRTYVPLFRTQLA